MTSGSCSPSLLSRPTRRTDPGAREEAIPEDLPDERGHASSLPFWGSRCRLCLEAESERPGDSDLERVVGFLVTHCPPMSRLCA